MKTFHQCTDEDIPPVHWWRHSTSALMKTLHQCTDDDISPVHWWRHFTSARKKTFHQCTDEDISPVHGWRHFTSALMKTFNQCTDEDISPVHWWRHLTSALMKTFHQCTDEDISLVHRWRIFTRALRKTFHQCTDGNISPMHFCNTRSAAGLDDFGFVAGECLTILDIIYKVTGRQPAPLSRIFIILKAARGTFTLHRLLNFLRDCHTGFYRSFRPFLEIQATIWSPWKLYNFFCRILQVSYWIIPVWALNVQTSPINLVYQGCPANFLAYSNDFDQSGGPLWTL